MSSPWSTPRAASHARVPRQEFLIVIVHQAIIRTEPSICRIPGHAPSSRRPFAASRTASDRAPKGGPPATDVAADLFQQLAAYRAGKERGTWRQARSFFAAF